MTTRTLPQTPQADAGDNEPHHLYCCNPDVAICGEDLTGDVDLGDEWIPGDELCPLCEVLDTQPCPRCGWTPA